MNEFCPNLPLNQIGHAKVYSEYGTSNNAGSTSYWICRNCGEEGTDFTPNKLSEYAEIKAKFKKG